MNPTLDHLVASARAEEIRWAERVASDRPRPKRLGRRPPASRASLPTERRPEAA